MKRTCQESQSTNDSKSQKRSDISSFTRINKPSLFRSRVSLPQIPEEKSEQQAEVQKLYAMDGKVNQRKSKKIGYVSTLRNKMRSMRQQSGGCSFFCKVLSSDLAQHNMLWSLLTSHSALNPRVLRLSLFYFHILLELTICAFFFDRDSPSQSLQFSTADILESFWVSIYSILLSLLPMLLLGLSIRSRSKTWLQLFQAIKQSKLEQELRLFRKKQCVRLCWTLFLFFLLSSLFSLYIIGFCQIDSPYLHKKWLISGFSSVILDMTAFELVPAFIVALVGAISFGCRIKWILCLAVVVEFYRGIVGGLA